MKNVYLSNFVNACPACGDYLETGEACDNCESESFRVFSLADAIEQAESVAELYNLR